MRGRVGNQERSPAGTDTLSSNNRNQPWQVLEQSQAGGTAAESKEAAEFLNGRFVFSAGEKEHRLSRGKGTRHRDNEVRAPGESSRALESTDGCLDWITRTEVAFHVLSETRLKV